MVCALGAMLLASMKVGHSRQWIGGFITFSLIATAEWFLDIPDILSWHFVEGPGCFKMGIR